MAGWDGRDKFLTAGVDGIRDRFRRRDGTAWTGFDDGMVR